MPARGSPNSLTIDQLTRELKLRNVTLPKSSIRKEVLVDLYKKHVLSESVANSPDVYSSDDDDPQQSINDNQSYDNNQEMTEADILSLSDSDLRAKLKSYDENVGPITNSTRSVYRKKLAKYISGELSAPNLNTTSAPVTTAYSDDDDEGDVEEGSHVSTHDVSVQNDIDYQENGDDQPDDDVDGGSSRVTKHVREVIETRYTEAVRSSSQPSVSSLWTRRYEEDKSSSTGGSSRSRRTLLAGRDMTEEASHGTARKGIYDNVFSSGDVRATPTSDFHRRSLALHGLTPRPPISSYSPSRSTLLRDSTYYQEAGDGELRRRVQQASSRSAKKAKVQQDPCFYKFLIAVLIVVLLSLFGYVVYLNVEPGYLPGLL